MHVHSERLKLQSLLTPEPFLLLILFNLATGNPRGTLVGVAVICIEFLLILSMLTALWIPNALLYLSVDFFSANPDYTFV